MLKRRRSGSLTLALTILLCALAPGGCKQTTEPAVTDNVSITVGFTGTGRVFAADPTVPFDCSSDSPGGCLGGFFDAGGGGVFDLVARLPDT